MATTTVAVLGIGATIVLLLLSAFFSSSETAMFSLPREWVEQRGADDDRRARVLKALLDDPHRLLVTLLVGNNVVNIAISSIVTVVLAEHLAAGPAVVATTLVSSAIVLVFGEIVPKSFGLGNAERWSLTVAPTVRLVERALSPLITLFDAVTRRMNDLIGADDAIEKPYVD